MPPAGTSVRHTRQVETAGPAAVSTTAKVGFRYAAGGRARCRRWNVDVAPQCFRIPTFPTYEVDRLPACCYRKNFRFGFGLWLDLCPGGGLHARRDKVAPHTTTRYARVENVPRTFFRRPARCERSLRTLR